MENNNTYEFTLELLLVALRRIRLISLTSDATRTFTDLITCQKIADSAICDYEIEERKKIREEYRYEKRVDDGK